MNLESAGLLDDQTAAIVKSLILEESLDVYRIINIYLGKVIDEGELALRLHQVAQQALGTYGPPLALLGERPMSPPFMLKNKKHQLQAYLNSITRSAFRSKEDQEILQRLIQEENGYVLSCFDVFDSDKDQESLIDSLQRIVEKTKAAEAARASFHGGRGQLNNSRSANLGMYSTPQNHSFGNASQMAASSHGMYAMDALVNSQGTRPPTSQWIPERLQHGLDQSSQIFGRQGSEPVVLGHKINDPLLRAHALQRLQ